VACTTKKTSYHIFKLQDLLQLKHDETVLPELLMVTYLQEVPDSSISNKQNTTAFPIRTQQNGFPRIKVNAQNGIQTVPQ
jgi:hypothetical protein